MYENFIYSFVPYDEFLVLTSNTVQFLNIKSDTCPNNFTKIFLFGQDKSNKIYRIIKNNLFHKKVKCYSFEELKLLDNPEKELGFIDNE